MHADGLEAPQQAESGQPGELTDEPRRAGSFLAETNGHERRTRPKDGSGRLAFGEDALGREPDDRIGADADLALQLEPAAVKANE